MKYTYLLMNAVFLLPLAAIVYSLRRQIFTKRWLVVLMIMFVLTAVFDSLIVGYGLVGYNELRYLGIAIGKAPIEDFAYTVAALLLVPFIWKLLRKEP